MIGNAKTVSGYGRFWQWAKRSVLTLAEEVVRQELVALLVKLVTRWTD
jgi:hypothetical protein